MKVRQVRLQAINGAGTQDFTVAGFGTPAWCIVICGGTAESAWAGTDTLCVGFYDGTTQKCCGQSGQDAQTPGSNLCRSNSADGKILTVQWTGAGEERNAVASFITDGVRLTWSDSGHRPYVTVIMGDSGSAKVGFHTASNDIGSPTVAETGVGFQPKLLVMAARTSNSETAGSGDFRWSVGFAADNGASIDQKCKAVRVNDTNPMDWNAHVSGSYGIAIECGTAGNPTFAQIDSMDADGFTTTVTASTSFGSSFFYLALGFTEEVKVFDALTPTAAGDWDPVTVAFTPQWAFMLPTAETALNTNRGGSEDTVEEFGLYSVTNNTGEEHGHYLTYEDGATVSTLYRGRTDERLEINTVTSSAPANLVAGAAPTFDSSGILYADANFNHNSSARYVLGFLVEEETGVVQKTASDSGSLITAAEVQIGDRTYTLADYAVLDAIESMLNDQFSVVLSSSDSGSITGDDSGNVVADNTAEKFGVESASTIGSVETGAVVAYDAGVTAKSATDVLDLADERLENFVPVSSQIGAPQWTRTHITQQIDFAVDADGNKIAERLFRDDGAASEASISVPVTLDQQDTIHTLYIRIKHPWLIDGSLQDWFWMDFANLGLDLKTWFHYDKSLEFFDIASTTRGADVLDAGVAADPPTSPTGETDWWKVYIRFRTSTDLIGNVKLGFADSDGVTSVVGPTSGMWTSYVAGFQVNEGTQTNLYLRNTQSSGKVQRSYEAVNLNKVDQYLASSDSGSIVGTENVRLGIIGTVILSKADSGSFSSIEIGSRTEDKFSTDTVGGLTSTESASIAKINYDPSWEEDDVPWGGQLLGAKDLAPVYVLDDSFFALGLGFDKPLECYIERRAVVFDRGLAMIGREVYPQIIGPDGGSVWISLGGHDTPDGAVDWEGPYEFKIGEDISVDFAVAGRYLAVRFESTETSVWDLQSFDIDYEITGVY